ncbi:L-fuculose kinase [Solimonas sp. K1W22B-7]|uniref:FGGY-family carbohydrate kinase n=1 Tax=Solimonas sp. K1W22B-7 TaxID=2303331 RepID=UPI000E332F43|nr:FGGY family carbohydrate kinase [Solimonas sp. K1W22B-7]AXQ30609.1 L-fuculose kinase [Solimonas sp. K1W22B-7]
MAALAVLDIGKTNAKLVVLDGQGRCLAERRRPNRVLDAPPFPHYDIDGLWTWLLDELAAAAKQYRITRLVTTTHGACAALVDEAGLVLPVLDYEYRGPEEIATDYPRDAAEFALSGSPALPAGLNLGRQLFWLRQRFPEEFARARHILMYPQYWAWRLCGFVAGEVASLGCHTDLWHPGHARYSGLTTAQGWDRLMPPLRPAWEALGRILPQIALGTGLPPDCEVISGIHDSNASLLPHLASRDAGQRFTVVSTGTWVIAAAIGAPLQRLNEQRDMLANVDARGTPVACARFMGGREFETLNRGGARDCADSDIDEALRAGVLALPAFAETGGPFMGKPGRIEGSLPEGAGAAYALASLYCALLTDHCLDALGSEGDIVVEGSFIANRHYLGLLAALRPAQAVHVSADAAGTVGGARILADWGQAHAPSTHAVKPLTHPLLEGYRVRWSERARQN